MRKAILTKIIEHAIEIQQVAAPTFAERARREFLQLRWQQWGIEAISTDVAGNLVGCVRGEGKQPPVVISAHLDTVFPVDTDLTIKANRGKITAPGIGDNSLGLAALAGITWILQERNMRLPGDLWLAANTCEEGLGDLIGMRAVVDRFGAQPLAYIVLEGMGLGDIVRGGLSVRRYRIHVRTSGGHSWSDYGKPSAVHELIRLSEAFLRLPVPQSPKSSINIGIVHGGVSVNTIAPHAYLELDIRSVEQGVAEIIAGEVSGIVRSFTKMGVQIEMENIGNRPSGEIPPDHWLVDIASQALQGVGVSPSVTISSTDANIPLSQGLAAITLGLTIGNYAHTVRETIRIAPLAKGMEALLQTLVGIYRQAAT